MCCEELSRIVLGGLFKVRALSDFRFLGVESDSLGAWGFWIHG